MAAAAIYLISLPACREGIAHDQSGLCVIDPAMPPPFLGFEYWEQLGIALSIIATGLAVAAFVLWRND
ncbi:MAG TPA: hypothetical protein VE961_12100 [Pyrinomonadaceae bacterium]|nr:hypothetical protein [Pyrinomonadaceae bacterium]